MQENGKESYNFMVYILILRCTYFMLKYCIKYLIVKGKLVRQILIYNDIQFDIQMMNSFIINSGRNLGEARTLHTD